MEASAKKIENPRVRIAPSPTGPFHIGTARTALFNYLFAKKHNGVFILRVEDTDRERSKKEFENDIVEGLKWLKILWDEGIDPENPKKYLGDLGPYKQSERGKIYQKYIKKLLEQGSAYYCFCTKEELEAHKQYQMSIGEPPRYSGKCRDLSESTVKKYLKEGKPSIIRFKTPAKIVSFNDLIKGKIEVDASLIGDIAIAKNETLPLYNLAVVIDDYEMKISHVLRGEDHISNTPKQLLLQEALGLTSPEYGHFALIMGQDRSKLSKRHGAVAVNEYREKGYLPEAIVNFMSFLGWNPGGEKEIYPLNVLVKEFSLERCQKSSAIFNLRKLDWLNGFYIRSKSPSKITELCLPYLIRVGLLQPIFETGQHLVGIGPTELKQVYLTTETKEKISPVILEKIIKLYQERLKNLSEIPELVDFFFKDKLDYPKGLLLWKDMDEKALQKALEALKTALSSVKDNDWAKGQLQEILTQKAAEFGPAGDRGYLLWPLRVALSGKKSSAPPFDIAEILGKEKTLSRLEQAQVKLTESKR
jgi:nondiscriminating glutamyl-tRNA synthetase